MAKKDDALYIDEQLKSIHAVCKIMFEQCSEVLNKKPGSDRYEELHKLTKGLQQFVVDYEKWKGVNHE